MLHLQRPWQRAIQPFTHRSGDVHGSIRIKDSGLFLVGRVVVVNARNKALTLISSRRTRFRQLDLHFHKLTLLQYLAIRTQREHGV